MQKISIQTTQRVIPRSELFQTMLREMNPLFWDTQAAELNVDEHSDYIISRLLNMGGMRGYLWVQKLYTEDDIRGAVIRRRDMRPVVRNFMAARYGIPKDSLLKTVDWR